MRLIDDEMPETGGDRLLEEVRAYYEALRSSQDLQTNATTCAEDTPPRYVLDVMPLVADEVVERFYGCGSPIPPALVGCTVLDLGCGTGRDVFVASKLVGPSGRVIGVDMTPSQIEVGERYRDYHARAFGFEESNVEFRLGYIEDLASLGIEDESVDVVISNCVINLSPFKDRIFSEIYRVLKPGGELFFSDVFCDRRLPDEVRTDPVIRGECLGGAMYTRDFEQMLARHGWNSHLECSLDAIELGSLELQTRVGFASFSSRTMRVIKAEGLVQGEEDYGQVAVFKGGMPDMPRYFDLDSDIRLIKGRPRAISSNMARMVAQSRYGEFFEISEPGRHRGAFDAGIAQESVSFSSGKQRADSEYLEAVCERDGIIPFDRKVPSDSLLQAYDDPATLQVNVTYRCNLSCSHCYLECSPKSTQEMDLQTMEACIEAARTGSFDVIDITGGSPELHPHIRRFVDESASVAHTIFRSNLVLLGLGSNRDLMEQLADRKVEIVASLPYFSAVNADRQRGEGVFDKSVEAIRSLNGLGYGAGGDLKLQLVYNVCGPFLPPPQDQLEELYKEKLQEEQGIVFDSLYAFNNWPLGRFADQLVSSNMFDAYMRMLADNFNALAVGRMMCRDMVNVDYDGRLYDCEVNHVLGMPIQLDGRDATVSDLAGGRGCARRILTSPVCYSCAAGFGSSCGGSLI